MNWLTKRVDIRPALLVGVLLALLIGSVGIAYALTPNVVTQTQPPWAGTSTITESDDLSVTDYSFTYTANLTQVTAVDITVGNGDAGATHAGDVDIAILDSGGTVKATGSGSTGVIAISGSVTITITLSSSVALADLVTLNIIVTQTS